MFSAFPHRLYLSAAIALASGGLAMTAATMSGDPADVHVLLIAYLSAYRVTVIAVIGASIYKLLKEN